MSNFERRQITIGMWVIAFAVLALNHSTASAQRLKKANAKAPFRENVTLPIDSNLLKRFGTVKELVEDQRWTEAIAVLQEIAQSENKSLVLVQSGKVGGVANYLNVATRCNVLLSQIPPEVRDAYRKKVDPQAKRWFENWQRSHDESELLRIVRQTFLSTYADDAVLSLGEAAWDRGDFSAARTCWESLIPLPPEGNLSEYPTVLRYPDASIDVVLVKARIILCSIMEREFVRAAHEIQRFAEDHSLAEGTIAGQSGRLVEILRRTFEESQKWKIEKSPAEVSTFGLANERYRRIPESIDVGSLRWVRSLPQYHPPRPAERLPFQYECLCYHPVVFDDSSQRIVIVNDSDSIRAWNILTGQPVWKTEHTDPSVIYPSMPEEATMISKMSCVGAPHFTMTISDGRLYARMGSPVTCSSIAELRRENPSEIVCLDLMQEGKLIWKASATELFPDPTTWRFEGSPIVIAGRAYAVVCRRHPQLELMVACLDAADGRLLWQRPLGAFRESVEDTSNRISHLLLTAGAGRIFLSTNAGAILSLDAHDGRLEWAVSYESTADEPNTLQSVSNKKALVPALFHGGFLFVAPSDANSAFCIEADSGRIHWQYQYSKNSRRETDSKHWRHLLGVVPGGIAGRLIVSGTSLWAIDIETGNLAWPTTTAPSKNGSNVPFGRGAIAGDQILFPLRESIEVFDAQSGDRIRTIPLKTREPSQQGGNLTIAGGMLLVSQSDRIAAFCEFSQLKERVEAELTQRPDDESLQNQMVELEAADGQLLNALKRLRNRFKQMNRDDPGFTSTRSKFRKLLSNIATFEFRDGMTVEGSRHFREALSLADDPKERVELTVTLARINDVLKHPERAIADYQSILADDRLAQIPRGTGTAGDEARLAISRIIEESGRHAYRKMESSASTELTALLAADNRPGMQKFLAKYSHAKVAAKARDSLVQRYRDSSQFSEAFVLLDEIRRNAQDDRSRAEATLNIIELLEQAGYTNSVQQFWNSLNDHSPNIQVKFGGKTHDLAELTRSHLIRTESNDRFDRSPLERTWSIEFPSQRQLIVPENEVPSPDLRSVITCFENESNAGTWSWRCLDWKTGQTRWEESVRHPIQSAAWTPVHLLIGASDGWRARSAESGRRIWDQNLGSGLKTDFLRGVNGSISSTCWPTVFDTPNGLRVIGPNDGKQVVRLKPPGHLHNIVGIDEHQTAVELQTLKPTVNWRAAATTPQGPWSIEEVSRGGEPWNSAPKTFENWMIAVNENNQLVGARFGESQSQITKSDDLSGDPGHELPNRWVNQNFPLSFTRSIVMNGSGQLLVLVDGCRLMAYDHQTGTKKWATGIADFPITAPSVQISTDSKCVYAASQGKLRAVSINDGTIRFEQYLGDTTPQWKTRILWSDRGLSRLESDGSNVDPQTALIATWPVDPPVSEPRMIRICDGTGKILQQMKVNDEPQGIILDDDGSGILWTKRSMTGIRFSTRSRIAESDPARLN